CRNSTAEAYATAGRGGPFSGRAGTGGADVRVLEPGDVERLDFNGGARVRCVQHVAVADVDADVPELVEEHEVADPQIALGDERAEVVLGGGEVRQRDAVAGPQPHDKTRAVKPGLGRRAAPHVRHADLTEPVQPPLGAGAS